MTLRRGPVGDPTSADPFERAQAQAPWGWHVEGQMFGYRMEASGPNAEGATVWVWAEGAGALDAADRLITAMQQVGVPAPSADA